VVNEVPAVSKRNVMELPAIAVFWTDTVSWPIWLCPEPWSHFTVTVYVVVEPGTVFNVSRRRYS